MGAVVVGGCTNEALDPNGADGTGDEDHTANVGRFTLLISDRANAIADFDSLSVRFSTARIARANGADPDGDTDPEPWEGADETKYDALPDEDDGEPDDVTGDSGDDAGDVDEADDNNDEPDEPDDGEEHDASEDGDDGEPDDSDTDDAETTVRPDDDESSDAVADEHNESALSVDDGYPQSLGRAGDDENDDTTAEADAAADAGDEEEPSEDNDNEPNFTGSGDNGADQPTLSVTVVDENGDPVARAQVTIWPDDADSPVDAFDGAHDDETDEDGTVKAHLADGTYEVIAVHDEVGEGSTIVELDGEDEEMEVRLTDVIADEQPGAPQEGWVEFDLDGATVDLTNVIGETAVPVLEVDLEAGRYSTIHLDVEDVTGYAPPIDDDEHGEELDVRVPSNRLRLVRPFEVEAGATAEFVFDIHVVRRGRSGGYNLRPVIGGSGVEGDDVEPHDRPDDHGATGRGRDDDDHPRGERDRDDNPGRPNDDENANGEDADAAGSGSDDNPGSRDDDSVDNASSGRRGGRDDENNPGGRNHPDDSHPGRGGGD